jgi:GTP cyclohydrolase II
VRLLTNNPEKVRSLENTVCVTERVAISEPRQASRKYQTKQTKFGHLLSLAGRATPGLKRRDR